VLAALDRNSLAESTIVIVTSDNGCSPEAKFDELTAKGHNPSYHFRGYKADIFDGGHRVPFIVRWPGRVKARTTSHQLICLTDLFATCADILGAKLPDNAAEDSVSILPALEGRDNGPLREAVVHHSINGSFALREKAWKLELCPDSGGWSAPRPGSGLARGLPPIQLYDLATDIGERTNLQDQHPEVAQRLEKLLERYVADDPREAMLALHADLEILVNVGGRERTTDEYAALLARSGLRLARTIPLGRAQEAMGHYLIEAQPV